MRDDWIILHAGALGDLVLTLHLALSIEPLRESDVVYVISRVDLRPLTGVGTRLEWRSPDALRTHWLFREDDAPAPGPLAELARGRLVLNFLGDRGSRVHARLLGLGAGEVLSVDPRPRTGDGRHIVEQWRGQLLGDSPSIRFGATPVPLLKAADEEAVAPTVDTPRIGGRLAIIHPGGGGVGKMWPIDRFMALGAALLDHGLGVRFVLGPTELERFPNWPALLTSIAPVDECTDVAALTARLRGVELFVGNDSGPGHVAAAVGVPTIALYGPTSAAVWRPVGPCSVSIRGQPGMTGWGIENAAILREIDSLLQSAAFRARAGSSATT